jgi:hypothetical protein
VPFCETCDRFYNPNTVRPDGTCPGCDEQLGDPMAPIMETTKAPWHFKVLLVAVVAYLGWRLVEGIELALRSL